MTNAKFATRYSALGLIAAGLFSLSAASFAAESPSARPIRAVEHQQLSGMTASQVEQALGKPLRVKTYSRTADTTWVYLTAETPRNAELQVDFGADGKVKGHGVAWANGRSGTPY